MATYLGYFYSVGTAANAKLPLEYQRKTTLFHLGLLAVFINMLLTIAFISVSFLEERRLEIPIWMAPILFFSVFGLFYGIWFTAKQFATLRLGQEANFSDYAQSLVLFYFCYIGVWSLQPDVNRYLGNDA
jgi:hypothetical protein